jgi:hypothetical protein
MGQQRRGKRNLPQGTLATELAPCCGLLYHVMPPASTGCSLRQTQDPCNKLLLPVFAHLLLKHMSKYSNPDRHFQQQQHAIVANEAREGMQMMEVQRSLDEQARRVSSMGNAIDSVASKQDTVLSKADDSAAALLEIQQSSELLQQGMRESTAAHAALVDAEALLSTRLTRLHEEQGQHWAAATRAWKVLGT